MNCPNVRWSKIWTSSWLAWRPRFLRFMTWRKFLKLQTTRHPSSDMNCDLLQLSIYKKMLRCPSIYRKLPSYVISWDLNIFSSIFSKWFCRKQFADIWSQSSPHPLRLVTQLERIGTRLNTTFKALAAIKTDIMTDELDKNPKNPKLLAFLLSALKGWRSWWYSEKKVYNLDDFGCIYTWNQSVLYTPGCIILPKCFPTELFAPFLLSPWLAAKRLNGLKSFWLTTAK